MTVTVDKLYPGTTYEVQAVSVHNGQETPSPIRLVRTLGPSPTGASPGWLIALVIAIILMLVVLIIVCLVVRNRGAKYPVQEKERAQGREPMLTDDKGFGEYGKPPTDEEKVSLTGRSQHGSETDSMLEYTDGEAGKFAEDGSFIGIYGAPPTGRSGVSTFA